MILATLMALALTSLAQPDTAIEAVETTMLPERTPLVIRLTQALDSKTAVLGMPVEFVLNEPVVYQGMVVFAQNSRVLGEVTHVQKAGFGGRPGELIVSARYLEHGKQRIALRSRLMYAASAVDKARSNASTVAVLVVGLPGMFITGGQSTLPANALAVAHTATPIPLPLRPSPEAPMQDLSPSPTNESNHDQ